MIKSVVITSAIRTAVGAYLRSLKSIAPQDLIAQILSEAVKRNGISTSDVDHIILGNVLSPTPNIARIAGLLAGFNDKIPAYTVNRLCASSLQAVINAYQSIVSGESRVVLAGGVENLSRAPYRFSEEIRFKGLEHGNSEVIDSFTYASENAQPQNLYPYLNMGLTAENIAKKYNISRVQQDNFAYQSQLKYKKAKGQNLFNDEIHPIFITDGKTTFEFTDDEHPRPETTFEKLSMLKPAFAKDGTVTAGNSSGLNDGASAVVIMSHEAAKAYNTPALVRIISYAAVGTDPMLMGLGVVPSIHLALTRAGLGLSDIDLFEINEAFAAQVIGCLIELGVDSDNAFLAKLNVNGGAIALGHALANSGTRMLTTLIYELRRRNKRYGLISMCVGGGQGITLIVENASLI